MIELQPIPVEHDSFKSELRVISNKEYKSLMDGIKKKSGSKSLKASSDHKTGTPTDHDVKFGDDHDFNDDNDNDYGNDIGNDHAPFLVLKADSELVVDDVIRKCSAAFGGKALKVLALNNRVHREPCVSELSIHLTGVKRMNGKLMVLIPIPTEEGCFDENQSAVEALYTSLAFMTFDGLPKTSKEFYNDLTNHYKASLGENVRDLVKIYPLNVLTAALDTRLCVIHFFSDITGYIMLKPNGNSSIVGEAVVLKSRGVWYGAFMMASALFKESVVANVSSVRSAVISAGSGSETSLTRNTLTRESAVNGIEKRKYQARTGGVDRSMVTPDSSQKYQFDLPDGKRQKTDITAKSGDCQPQATSSSLTADLKFEPMPAPESTDTVKRDVKVVQKFDDLDVSGESDSDDYDDDGNGSDSDYEKKGDEYDDSKDGEEDEEEQEVEDLVFSDPGVKNIAEKTKCSFIHKNNIKKPFLKGVRMAFARILDNIAADQSVNGKVCALLVPRNVCEPLITPDCYFESFTAGLNLVFDDDNLAAGVVVKETIAHRCKDWPAFSNQQLLEKLRDLGLPHSGDGENLNRQDMLVTMQTYCEKGKWHDESVYVDDSWIRESGFCQKVNIVLHHTNGNVVRFGNDKPDEDVVELGVLSFNGKRRFVCIVRDVNELRSQFSDVL